MLEGGVLVGWRSGGPGNMGKEIPFPSTRWKVSGSVSCVSHGPRHAVGLKMGASY